MNVLCVYSEGGLSAGFSILAGVRGLSPPSITVRFMVELCVTGSVNLFCIIELSAPKSARSSDQGLIGGGTSGRGESVDPTAPTITHKRVRLSV
jgi:hypothetical protein